MSESRISNVGNKGPLQRLWDVETVYGDGVQIPLQQSKVFLLQDFAYIVNCLLMRVIHEDIGNYAGVNS